MSNIAILKKPKFYGWIALAGVMLVYGIHAGTIWYAYGVFLPFMTEEFHWSRSALSGPYSIFLASYGILGPLVGISVSKFGARKNIVVGNILNAIGLAGMAFVHEIWQVYLFFGIFIGVGCAFGINIASTTVVTNWFVKRRSLAMGLLFGLGGVFGLTFPPFIGWLASNFGWREAWLWMAAIQLLFVVILAALLIRNTPEEMSQTPEGKTEAKVMTPSPERVYATSVEWKVSDALRTRALWLILILSTASAFTTQLVSTHQVAYLQDLGFSPLVADSALGLFAGASVIGRIGAGALGTRFESRHLASGSLGAIIIGIIILMNAKTLPLIYSYTIISGIGYGGMYPVRPTMIGAYFGRNAYARITGWTAPITSIVGAISPVLGGFIFDKTGSYFWAFGIAVAFLAVGLISSFLAVPPKYKVAPSR